jgi:hypothetical protein
MNLKDTLWELFGKNRDEIGTVELSSIDKVRAMSDHVDFIYNGKSIFRGFNEDKFIFTSVGLSDRKQRDRLNACLYAQGTPCSVYMKDGKVYFCYGAKLMRNSFELDGVSMYKTDFVNNCHTFEKF